MGVACLRFVHQGSFFVGGGGGGGGRLGVLPQRQFPGKDLVKEENVHKVVRVHRHV